MGRFVDSIIAYRILTLLVTPFNKTAAYNLGIIDEKGKELKKMSNLNTVEERDAYTLLHRLVFRLKKMIEKVPIENKKLLSMAAAYALIREYYEQNLEPISLEKEYINILETNLTEEVALIESILNESKMFTFKQFNEEVPVNNAGTPGVAGLDKDVPVSKKNQLKYVKKNRMFRR